MPVWLKRAVLALLGTLFLISVTAYLFFEKSLPILEGHIQINSLSGSVQIERDAAGIPVIKGKNRVDVAFATGYLHAQDRFFQMDLLRRNSAGELSELFGEVTLEHDQSRRKHRFRQVARRSVLNLSVEDQILLKAYTGGVNQGLKGLASKPFEYWLLESEPEPWQIEDAFLSVFSLYLDLHDNIGKLDQAKGFLSGLVSPEVIDFLSPLYTRWDAPLKPGSHRISPLPTREAVNLRAKPAAFYSEPDALAGLCCLLR